KIARRRRQEGACADAWPMAPRRMFSFHARSLKSPLVGANEGRNARPWLGTTPSCASHSRFQKLTKRGKRARIEHVLLFQRPTPGLPDAETKIGEMLDTMRIRINAHQHALGFRRAAMNVGKIQPIGMGVQL